ncbi:F-box only protein 21 [Octopus sinensis]|nr:F-box only protein 21 [Octopus sinensis]
MAVEAKILPQLPTEILVKILCCDTVSHVDICRLAFTCHRMRDICLTENIWKCKFFQCWPNVLPKTKYHMPVAWRKLFIRHYTCIQNVNRFLQNLAEICYNYEEVPPDKFHIILQYIDEDENNRDFITSYLHLIASDPVENLTKKYYAGKTLQHIQHHSLSKAWHSYLSLPINEQKLEIGTIYMHNWHCFLETTNIEDILQKLDTLAYEVKKELAKFRPDHPTLGKEDLYDTIDTNLWNPTDTRDILIAMNNILYKKHRFHAEEYSSMDLLNINKVLISKRCLRWIVTVIYQSVARRLGVLLEPIPPFMQLLRWQEHPNEQASYKQYTYLNTNESGRFLSETQCYHLHNEEVVIPPRRWFHNIATKLLRVGRIAEGQLMVRNYMKLAILLDPEDLDMLAVWVEYNVSANVNLEQVLISAQRLLCSEVQRFQCLGKRLIHRIEEELAKDGESKPEALIPRRRADNQEVEFSVGLIMKHKRYDYMCVITGWDKKCMASQEWILGMDVDRLQNQRNQPFYDVLVNDGSNRYAAQENLCMPDHGEMIQHNETGRYFQKFCDNYYFPNEQTMTKYPDDLAVTQQIIQTHYGCL